MLPSGCSWNNSISTRYSVFAIGSSALLEFIVSVGLVSVSQDNEASVDVVTQDAASSE